MNGCWLRALIAAAVLSVGVGAIPAGAEEARVMATFKLPLQSEDFRLGLRVDTGVPRHHRDDVAGEVRPHLDLTAAFSQSTLQFRSLGLNGVPMLRPSPVLHAGEAEGADDAGVRPEYVVLGVVAAAAILAVARDDDDDECEPTIDSATGIPLLCP